MSSERSPRELIAEAWQTMFVDERRAATLGRLAAERARRAGDAEGEALGLFHATWYQVRWETETAGPALDRTTQRCRELGFERGVWLCDDLAGFLALHQGRIQVALEAGRGNALRTPEQRPALERYVTQHLLRLAAGEQGHFEEALRHGHRMLLLADEGGAEGHRALALHNLGSLQMEAFNLEDARPVLEEALQIWRGRGAAAVTIGNLLYVYIWMGLPELAHQLLSDWFAQPGGVSSQYRHHKSAPMALTYINVGRYEEAEEALAMGPLQHVRFADHLACEWTWVRGRLLCATGRFAEARELCKAYIDRMPQLLHVDYACDRYQLHDVVRTACDALGDVQGAMAAARGAYAACVPLVGTSARARLLSLQLERQGLGNVEPPSPSDRRRLAVLDDSLRRYGEALQQQQVPARAAASATPSPAPPPGPVAAVVERQRRFVAHVSHEMRTPISGVIGMTSLLLLSNLDERQRKFVTMAQSSAETLLQLVNDLLDLAKLESGRFQLDPRPFALGSLAAELTDVFQPAAQGKGLKLHLIVDPALPPQLRGDALRIRQVLTNLLANAIKFTSAGEVSLSVRVRGRKPVDPASSSCDVRFEVRDTGKGIGVEAQKRLFTEFMQEDAATATEFGGTGLGLALCRQLVELMAGRIGVDSERGKGSLFWFELELPVEAEERFATTTQ